MAEHRELFDRDTDSFVVDVYQMLHAVYLALWRKEEGSMPLS